MQGDIAKKSKTVKHTSILGIKNGVTVNIDSSMPAE